MAWLSPAFPVGGFSYSHGSSARCMTGWSPTPKASPAGWRRWSRWARAGTTPCCSPRAWRRARDGGDLDEIAELAEALAGSQERHTETMLQGAAFLKAAAAWPNPVLEPLAGRMRLLRRRRRGCRRQRHRASGRARRLPAGLLLQSRPGGDPARRRRPERRDCACSPASSRWRWRPPRAPPIRHWTISAAAPSSPTSWR